MIAAGRGPPSWINSSRWNSAVGALPMATTAPSRRSPHNETAAAERVVPQSRASAVARGSFSRQQTSLSAGSRRPGDAGGEHLRVGEDRRAGPQRGPGGGHESVMESRSPGRSMSPARVDHPDRDHLGVRREVRRGRLRRGSSRTSGGRSPRVMEVLVARGRRVRHRLRDSGDRPSSDLDRRRCDEIEMITGGRAAPPFAAAQVRARQRPGSGRRAARPASGCRPDSGRTRAPRRRR